MQRQVVAALWAAEIAVAVVDPAWVRNFAKGRGRRPRAIARTPSCSPYTRNASGLLHHDLRPIPRRLPYKHWSPGASSCWKCWWPKNIGSRTLCRNCAKEVRHHISYLKGRLQDLEDEIDKTVRRSEAWRRKTEILRSVPGVGKVLSSMLLAKLPELGTLNRKQVGALVGLPPPDGITRSRSTH